MTMTKVLRVGELYPDIDRITQDAFCWRGPNKQCRKDLPYFLKRQLRSALRICHKEYNHNWRRYVRQGKDLRVLDYEAFIPRERALSKLEMRIRRMLNIK